MCIIYTISEEGHVYLLGGDVRKGLAEDKVKANNGPGKYQDV